MDETVPEGSLRVPQYAELLMELTNLMAESGNTMHTQYNMDRGDFFVIMENKDRERLEIVRGTPLLDAMSEFYIKVKGRKK